MIKKFDEYDVVVARVDLGQNVKAGTMGAILLVLDQESGVYEVEFVDDHGATLEVMTVDGENLQGRKLG
ncbi:DUF4926 domain-containing protein [Pseudoxanthomonas sp. CF125]|uniref:DUF4926 domain-containing protein n=1 Tax=Pseudoxanthomonas sp. CF125 TaxID=1855303 RepID=UPI00088BE3F8|nr:DUF4926 domain-containing protein [Pseudoxanthomonas sp. CF125]SDQ24612.1 protein of unknown function [Pseudoxanthomonas sp. CF125]